MIIADKTGQIHYSDHGGHGPDRPDRSKSRPEIDRNQLINLLLSPIPDGRMRWNRKVLSISPGSDNRWNINLDGTEAPQTFDLVVGADGAWSRVRQVLTDVKSYYSGVHCITPTIPNISSKSKLAESVGNGSLLACSDGKALMAQRGSTDSVRIYAMLTSPSAMYLSSLDPPLDDLPMSALKQSSSLIQSISGTGEME
jgi:2-polyprenyl-6-methoxyphenol hydroxylase-like FAD-dependent oxidoreductase